MELLIGRSSLLKMVSVAQRVVPKKSTKPILTHLMLEASLEEGLTISATDEEMSFFGTTPAQVNIGGKMTVSAKDLYDIIRNLPEQTVKLSFQEAKGILEIQSDRIEFRLHTLPSDDFPKWSDIEPEVRFEYPIELLHQLIDRTIFAVSYEETRYYLGGVFLECNEGEHLRAVATDGHRLALAEDSSPPNFSLSPGRILPRKLLQELKKMFDQKYSSHVSFGFQDKKVMFQYGNQMLVSLLVEGSFPDYKQVIPKEANLSCRVKREELFDALRRISLLSPDKTGGVRLTLTPTLLKISSEHTGRGEAKQEVEILEGGGDVEVGFNANYFVDALQGLATEDVLLEFTNHLSPCVLRPYYAPDTDQESFTQTQLNVIMPMRL